LDLSKQREAQKCKK